MDQSSSPQQHVTEEFLEEIAMGRTPAGWLAHELGHLVNCPDCMERLGIMRKNFVLLQRLLSTDSEHGGSKDKKLFLVGGKLWTNASL
jgi:hypothetical protein